MPFEKGNQLAKLADNPGRRVYTLEQKQVDEMRELVNKDMALLKKLYEGKFTKQDLIKLQVATSRISKYLDKLHASKESTEGTQRVILPIPLLHYLDAQAKQLNEFSNNNSDRENLEAE